jgi:protein CrcB
VSPATYLWIALGGALGSVGRAWLAFAVARALGPQFPWGTILVNVVGSFVIGFFGTLTAASDGRFALPADARAFVMVGVCGGFTTFSSFSLQTLELARDGRPGEALANVALSLALCLASVAAGHYGAASLNQGWAAQEEAARPGPATAAGVALAVLDRPDAAPGVLTAAARMLEVGGGGRVEALAVTPRPEAALLPTEEVMTERRADDEAGRARSAALRAAFEAWAGQARARGSAVGWTEVEGPPGGAVAERGRRADSVVVRRPDGRGDGLAREALHAALFEAGCPVLVLPPGPGAEAGFGRVVAIAWKDDGRAAKAVRSAVPWLRRAERVVVLCAGEGGSGRKAPAAPPVLAEHGINVRVVAVPADGGRVGADLLAVARGLGADLLVMGAFAHGELRERVLGGVTRHVLSEADLPVLMQH